MLTVKPALAVYDVVNKYFKNETDSRSFVSGIEEMMDNKADIKMNDFATKKDLAEMHFATKQDISDLRIEFKQDISELRAEVKEDISHLRAELKEDISGLRVEVKHDINELRSDFQRLDASLNLNLANAAFLQEKSQKEQLRWLIGAMVTIISLAVAVLKLT